MPRLRITLLVIALLSASALAAVKSVRITEWGVYGQVTAHRAVTARYTTTGSVEAVSRPTLIQRTTSILAHRGTRFGIRYIGQGDGFDKAGVVIRVIHPPIHDPTTGKTTTVDQWTGIAQVGVSNWAGWAFDHRWELVSGRWIIQVVNQHGKVEAQKTFTVKALPG